MIFFESLLTPFESNVIFEAAGTLTKTGSILKPSLTKFVQIPLSQASFFETAGALAKIGASQNRTHHNQV